MPLTHAPRHKPLRVTEIHGGHVRLARLAEMGPAWLDRVRALYDVAARVSAAAGAR